MPAGHNGANAISGVFGVCSGSTTVVSINSIIGITRFRHKAPLPHSKPPGMEIRNAASGLARFQGIAFAPPAQLNEEIVNLLLEQPAAHTTFGLHLLRFHCALVCLLEGVFLIHPRFTPRRLASRPCSTTKWAYRGIREWVAVHNRVGIEGADAPRHAYAGSNSIGAPRPGAKEVRVEYGRTCSRLAALPTP